MRQKNTPNDPDRRDRIVTATIHLLQDSGIAKVTARAVADAAGVPVGSVSYYFDSLPSLLLEASRRVMEQRHQTLAVWRKTVTAGTVVERVAELVHHQLTDDRALTVVAYELYILGLRDSRFREVSDTSIRVLREHLADFCSPTRAAQLAATADGFQLESLFQPSPPSLAEVIAVLVDASASQDRNCGADR